jgi:hypothetical protein
MQPTARTIRVVLICLAVVCLVRAVSAGQREIKMRASAKSVSKYEKLEFQIDVGAIYDDPFDPEQVDVSVVLETPSDEQVTLPAFYCQDYERRKLNQGRGRENWYYPIGQGSWKARFAPMETGTYAAAAELKDQSGTARSNRIQFECTTSSRKGFVRAGRKNPRFFEFTEGGSFFATGQNLAFIGESQYVNLSKAEEIFAKLSENGANFLRIWTCCKDWAMAIEARKSAWGRSWAWNPPIVPVPGSEDDPEPRKCVRIQGDAGTSISASPSHPVALRPQTRYVIAGRLKAEGPTALQIRAGRENWEIPCDAAGSAGWQKFRREFISGENAYWLGRISLSLAGSGSSRRRREPERGTIWLDGLSLKEAAGGPELLWEADVNRPVRGYYNQLDCFILDELLEAAEGNGIYLMLCLITRDLYMKSLSDEQSAEYEQATQAARNLMRYAVARWGYSTSVAAWEYFNEMDPGKPTERFYDDLGRYLEQIDIYHHLRTTSTWHPSARDCRHPRIDIAQLHHYMRPQTKEDYKDEVAVVLDKARFLRQHAPNKPALIGEFGLATPKWGLSEHMKQDSAGVHFHNCLWASAFSGVSGTTLFWWWDQLDRQNAYGHYQPLAKFLDGVSFAGLQQAHAKASGADVRVLGLQGTKCAYLWIFNPQATWWNLVVQQNKASRIEAAALQIRGLEPGHYRVQWWDTYEAKIIERKRISLPGDSLRIAVPSFSRDIACRIEPR